jgi:cell division protein FtsI/penicillin-binding protein 2
MARSHKEKVRKRATWLFVMLVLLYAGVAGRLVYVQICNADHYRDWAGKIRFRDIAIPASRGSIYDRFGRVLAMSVDAVSVFANRNEVKDPDRTAVRVASIIGAQPVPLGSKFERGSTIVWLGKKIDPRLADQLSAPGSRLPGVGIERDQKRVYPSGALAAQVLGFTGYENEGKEGVERVLDDLLCGRDGLVRGELDARRRIIPETKHTVRPPENGKDVFLTIDTTIQHVAEQALRKMAARYHPASACAIVMDPKTGEILALANYPSFDPNRPGAVKPERWRNRAVADLYEPGSTLKVLTVAAGLNEKLSPNMVWAHCTGREKMRGGIVLCPLHHPFESGHGVVDMRKIIEHSCNIGAAHVAMRLGADKMRAYAKSFGLLDRPQVGLGCEATGYLEPGKDWHPIRLANIGFGQGIAVTPLQMAGMYAVIANDGVLMQPRLIREVRNADGSVYKSFEPRPVRRVISKKAARELAAMLAGCVEEGTGKSARIEGRTVAGKTGSAQIPRADGKGYESGAFVASFMGFAPVRDPRLVIAVVVHRPKVSHWGATVAAPVFREIGEKALWYLKVPADAPAAPKARPRQESTSNRLA